jgi:putative endonuclease
MEFVVYILRCGDGTLYTGYSSDVEKRVCEHNIEPKGAKYTKARRPVYLAYKEIFESKSDAMRREIEIKKYTRKEKLKLIEGN